MWHIFPSIILNCYLSPFLLFSHPVMSDSATPWTADQQASPSFTISQGLLKLMSIESMMPSNPLILCHSLLLLPSIFSSIRVLHVSVLSSKIDGKLSGQGLCLSLLWVSDVPNLILQRASAWSKLVVLVLTMKGWSGQWIPWWIPLWSIHTGCCCCCCVTSVVSDSVRPHRRQPTRGE